MAKEGLSKRQKEILDYIHQYTRSSGRPPTIREIGQAVKISSTSVVNYNLIKLSEKGYLARDAEVSRGLRLTDKAVEMYGAAVDALRGFLRVPIAGTIVASAPVEVGHDSYTALDEDDIVELSPQLMRGKRTDDLFALRVSGDSMVDAMVGDGDIVIMRPQETASDGDMVAVWLLSSGTTTLKHFYHEGERIRLQPANPTLDPIFVDPADVQVQGKVMMVLRQTA